MAGLGDQLAEADLMPAFVYLTTSGQLSDVDGSDRCYIPGNDTSSANRLRNNGQSGENFPKISPGEEANAKG